MFLYYLEEFSKGFVILDDKIRLLESDGNIFGSLLLSIEPKIYDLEQKEIVKELIKLGNSRRWYYKVYGICDWNQYQNNKNRGNNQ